MAAFSRQCDTCARPRPPKSAVLIPVYPWVIGRVLYLSAFCWNSLKDFLDPTATYLKLQQLVDQSRDAK